MFLRSALLTGLVFACLGLLLGGCESKTERLPNAISPGTKAPHLTLVDLDGRPVSLSDFQGKLVLLNFWATWCPPCLKELPSLQRLHALYGKRGLVVLGVSVDNDQTAVEIPKLIDRYGLGFSIARDKELVAATRYGVSGFPESFFISPNQNFLRFANPLTESETVRIISDQPWDSPAFLEVIEVLLKEHTT